MHMRKIKENKLTTNKINTGTLYCEANSNIGLLPAALEFHCKGRLRRNQFSPRVKQSPFQLKLKYNGISLKYNAFESVCLAWVIVQMALL